MPVANRRNLRYTVTNNANIRCFGISSMGPFHLNQPEKLIQGNRAFAFLGPERAKPIIVERMFWFYQGLTKTSFLSQRPKSCRKIPPFICTTPDLCYNEEELSNPVGAGSIRNLVGTTSCAHFSFKLLLCILYHLSPRRKNFVPFDKPETNLRK